MDALKTLLENNRHWSQDIRKKNPDFFKQLPLGQAPDYLYIGCSDSRVVPTELLGLQPGEVFVHRNIANFVKPDDPNTLSTIQYALEVLNIRNIIVCGHTGCGGLYATLNDQPDKFIKHWLSDLKKLADTHKNELERVDSPDEKSETFCRINVKHQVKTISNLELVKQTAKNSGPVHIYGVIFDLNSGLLQDIETLSLSHGGCL